MSYDYIIIQHKSSHCNHYRYYFSALQSKPGELNLDKKWQSDDLFYIIMNEIHPHFNQFCVTLKLS